MTRRLLAAMVALLLGCAAGRVPLDRPDADPALVTGADARALAIAGLRSWIGRGDAVLAARRVEQALQRDAADPWAQTAAALLAERRLDDRAELTHLLAAVTGAPSHPLALIAAGRLHRLAETAPPLARAAGAGLGPVQARLTGILAARVRLVRSTASLAAGDRRGAEALRRQTGLVDAWTIAGPFAALHALDFDEPYAPERGELPREVVLPGGMPPVASRALPVPDGLVTLDGEPAGGDIYYLAAEAVAERGGEYLLSVRTNASIRIWVDGVAVLERRAFAAVSPAYAWAPVVLAAGKHHLLVKVARGASRCDVAVALPRADGGEADLAFSAAAPGARFPPARAGAGAWPGRARDLLARLEPEGGPEVAALLAASEVREWDREGAKAILRDALARTATSPPLLALRAETVGSDPTWSDRSARASAEADLDRALSLDAGDVATRVARAERMLEAGRADDANALLEPLATAEPQHARVLLARARVARARNLPALAERLAEEARRAGDDCAALDLLFNLPSRRNAVAKQDEDAEALSRCRGGLEQLIEHRQRRGDLGGALAAAEELVRGAPARIDARLGRAALLAASGRHAGAAADLADLAALWPRDARIEKRRAEFLEAGGNLAAARAARERALLLDASDLPLRRTLALERMQLPLDDVAEDGLAAIARYRAAAPAYATSSVTVLDFAAVEVHPGGAYTERTHTLVEARDQRAVDHVGEVTVPDGAELLLARTVKRDGAILDAEEPVGDKRSLSLAGLEPGDFAEWEWIRTVPARGPAVPGYTTDAFLFRADMPLWRSTYVIRAPASLGMEVDAHGMEPATPEREGDRLVLRRTREDVPALLPEPDATNDAEQLPFLQVGAGATPDALARAVADALVDAARPTLELRAFAEQIRASVAGGDRDALVRAAYRRVNERILGGGGFDEPASVILSRGRGNRTVVLKAVLAALGVPARIALVRDFSRDPAPYRFPRPDHWAYAVLRVERDGEAVWLDPTTRLAAYGVLPPIVRDAEAMVLPEPGERVVVTRTPAGTVEAERRRATLDIVVDAEGAATIDAREEYRGHAAATLRVALEQLDVPARRQMTEHALARSFRGPALLDVVFEGEADPEAPLVVHYRARVDRWAHEDGSEAVVATPLLPARLGARFLQLATRQKPLLISSDERMSVDVRVHLPTGWRPIPAADLAVESAHGSYHRRERVEGSTLVRRDTFDLPRARIAPAAYDGFSRWARTVDAAQRRPLVFDRGGRPAADAQGSVPAAVAGQP